MSAKPTKLNARQKRFVQEYLVDLNGTQAAIRAGFTKRSAYVCGSRLLHEPLVRTAIKKAMENRARRTRISADRVLRGHFGFLFKKQSRLRWHDAARLSAR